MTETWLIVVLIMTAPVSFNILLWAYLEVIVWYFDLDPPHKNWQTFKEGVLFMYVHFPGRFCLMFNWQRPAEYLYGIANQDVYREENGHLVVTPEKND